MQKIINILFYPILYFRSQLSDVLYIFINF